MLRGGEVALTTLSRNLQPQHPLIVPIYSGMHIELEHGFG